MTDSAEQQPKALPPSVHMPERIDLDDVHLRRLTLDDVDAVHLAIKDSFAEIHPWMPWCTEPVKLEDQREFVERTFVNWAKATSFEYGLFDAEDRLLGVISLMDRVGPGGLEIGYWLRTDATGKGLITRAAHALTELALNLPEITRIEIHCDAANLRSAAVPRRLGFRLEREIEQKITAPGESGREQHWVTS